MTSTEKIVVFGGLGIGAWLWFSRPQALLASTATGVTQPQPSALDALLRSLPGILGGLGSAFGGGPSGGSSGGGTGGSSSQPQGSLAASLDHWIADTFPATQEGGGPDGETTYVDSQGFTAYPQGDGTYADEWGNAVYITNNGTITYDDTQAVGYVLRGEPDLTDQSGGGSLDYTEDPSGDWSYTDDAGVTYQGNAAGETWDNSGN